MSTVTRERVRFYEVGEKNTPSRRVIGARSLGKAKSAYFDAAKEWFPDIKFKNIVGRLVPPPVDENLERVKQARGIPFAKLGMRLTVDGKSGVIVGANCSGNLDVIFDGTDYPMNCHPWWRVTYFDESGNILKEYRK